MIAAILYSNRKDGKNELQVASREKSSTRYLQLVP